MDARCYVNGEWVGEGGTFEEPVAPVFIDGKLDRTLRGDRLVDEFEAILEDYVARRFPASATHPRPGSVPAA